MAKFTAGEKSQAALRYLNGKKVLIKLPSQWERIIKPF